MDLSQFTTQYVDKMLTSILPKDTITVEAEATMVESLRAQRDLQFENLKSKLDAELKKPNGTKSDAAIRYYKKRIETLSNF